MFKTWLELQEGQLTPTVIDAILEIIQNIPEIDDKEIHQQLLDKGIKIQLSVLINKLNVFKMWSNDRKLMDAFINFKSMGITNKEAILVELRRLGWKATSTWPIEALFKLASLPAEKFYSYQPRPTKKRIPIVKPTPMIASPPKTQVATHRLPWLQGATPLKYSDDDNDDDDYTPIQPRFGTGGGKRVIKSTRHL